MKWTWKKTTAPRFSGFLLYESRSSSAERDIEHRDYLSPVVLSPLSPLSCSGGFLKATWPRPHRPPWQMAAPFLAALSLLPFCLHCPSASVLSLSLSLSLSVPQCRNACGASIFDECPSLSLFSVPKVSYFTALLISAPLRCTSAAVLATKLCRKSRNHIPAAFLAALLRHS